MTIEFPAWRSSLSTSIGTILLSAVIYVLCVEPFIMNRVPEGIEFRNASRSRMPAPPGQASNRWFTSASCRILRNGCIFINVLEQLGQGWRVHRSLVG